MASQNRFIIVKQIAFIRNPTFRYKRMMDVIRGQVYVLQIESRVRSARDIRSDPNIRRKYRYTRILENGAF